MCWFLRLFYVLLGVLGPLLWLTRFLNVKLFEFYDDGSFVLLHLKIAERLMYCFQQFHLWKGLGHSIFNFGWALKEWEPWPLLNHGCMYLWVATQSVIVYVMFCCVHSIGRVGAGHWVLRNVWIVLNNVWCSILFDPVVVFCQGLIWCLRLDHQ